MANLGNAWHIPANPEPRGRAGMRDPVGAIVPGTAVTILTGNQFQGGGNAGNQLQDGSTLFFRRQADGDWTAVPLRFDRTVDNNKYYAATLPAGTFQVDDVVQYYLRIAYDDHDTTFLRAAGDASAVTEDEAAARAAPFTFTVESSAVRGEWGPVFPLPNVGIHASVLPDGRVLMWGRRDRPSDSLDAHECTPFVWDPRTGSSTDTPQPTLADGTKVNLFCAGHAFLPDGRLLVAGGHWADGDGLGQAALYDWRTNRWTATDRMVTTAGQELRRWYPTLTALPNGNVLVLSGSYLDANRQFIVVDLLQVWEDGEWQPIPKADGTPLNFIGLPLYPRMHVASDGRVLMAGTLGQTYLLKTTAPGEWTPIGARGMGNLDYCPSVMYDADKVIYIGGGGGNGVLPAQEAEVIDLSRNPPAWRRTASMNFRRRQHNGVILPDGTVLVTGGTRGVGGPDNGFNDLAPGQPVHTAELWDPATERWTVMAAEAVDRCYHGTAVLLPDATVLSAGSGEYRPDNVRDNDPEDSHRDAQVFSPSYLFKGPRPEITSAPDSVAYGERFAVATPRADDVGRVSWVRLPSVTHSFDQNQRINFLQFTAGAGEVTVTAPASANACPPGHYMLFLLSRAGVPSIAHVVQVQAPAADAGVLGDVQFEAAAGLGDVQFAAAADAEPAAAAPRPETYIQVHARRDHVVQKASGTPVTVGITGTCPYGIGACWGGAYEALKRLEGVELVNPIPNAADSTAEVFMRGERLPPLDGWNRQFRDMVNGAYDLRGVEVTLRGPLDRQGDVLFLAAAGERVQLAPLAPEDKVQWDRTAKAPRPLEPAEASAYETLLASPMDGEVGVTGPLQQAGAGYRLEVRLVQP